MANKKLKVEVELETAKAKQQLGRMGDGVDMATSTPSTRSADKLAEATRLNTHQMMSMTRAFSGMALGLAASYSSRYFTQGSTAEKILGYGGAALTGASAGAMMGAAAGPVGMAVGGLAGAGIALGKEYLDRDEKITKAIEEYKRAEDVLASNEKFANDIKKISSAFNTENLSVKLARLSDQYEFYLKLIDIIKASIDENLAGGNLEGASKLQQQLSIARSRKDVIVSVAEKMDSSYNGPSRPSMVATDALMKLGGGFGLPQSGSGGTVEVLKNGIVQTNKLLEDIRANTGKKGGSWL